MGTDKKINVCHLISGDLWAGAEVQMFTLVAALKTCPGLKVSAIVLNEGKLANKLGDIEIENTIIDESKNGFYQILNQAKTKLKNAKIDILHSHRYKENILGAFLKKNGLTRRLVQTVHGTGEPFSGIKLMKAKLYSYIDRYYTNRYYDKILAVSNDIQDELREKLDADKMITIHNAINSENLVISKKADEIRKEFGIREGELVIGTAGRMVPIKGYHILLDTAAIILGKLPHAKFLIVGDGPMRTELEDRAGAMNFRGKVIFPGFREDIIDIINCLDIFVISSYHEGIPMALLEAMALKKAVAATSVGGVKEIIEDNISGLLCSPGDPNALAELCFKILKDENLRESLEFQAAKRIRAEFDIEVLKNRMINLYREMASEK